jgi:predicted RNA-binding Zn ribbon-like protein
MPGPDYYIDIFQAAKVGIMQQVVKDSSLNDQIHDYFKAEADIAKYVYSQYQAYFLYK